MKKKRIELFPEIESFITTTGEKNKFQLNDLSPGNIYRIGQPSKNHYQYIRPFINLDKSTATASDDFKEIQGLIIRVISILSMVNGKRIAVLRQYHDKLFLGKFEKVFAHVDMSIAHREIVQLDIETKQTETSTER